MLAAAGTPTADALVVKVNSYIRSAVDYTATFEGTTVTPGTDKERSMRSKMYFKRPSLMRMDTESPMKTVSVSDGKILQSYTPAMHVLTKMPMEGSPLVNSGATRFLSGERSLGEEFTATMSDCTGCRGAQLRLVPKKPMEGLSAVLVDADPLTGRIWSIRSESSNGRFRIDDIKVNNGLKAETFQIVVPTGTQVMDLASMKQPGNFRLPAGMEMPTK